MDDRQRAKLDSEMARLADGDRDAFDDVFDALWPVVHAFVARALGGGADAEDAAQSAMMKLFAQASDYEAGRSALTWALTIAAWEVRTVRKRRARSRTVVAETDALADAAPDAEEALARKQLDAALAEALGALSAEDRATLSDTFHAELDAPRSPRDRKRKERALGRLRALFLKFVGGKP